MSEQDQHGAEYVPPARIYRGPAMPPPQYGVPDYLSGGARSYTYARKPGIVTAIGVISIIVASLTLLACGIQTVQTLFQTAVVQAARMKAQLTRYQSAAASAQAAAAQPTQPGPDGLTVDERQTAANVLARRQALTIPRLAQLDEL